MKGIFNLRPPLSRYSFAWNVGKVLKYRESLYPLHSLSMKFLTLKCTALIALATAQRSQTLSVLDLKFVCCTSSSLIFRINTLLKTTKPNRMNQTVTITSFHKPQICPVKYLKHHIHKTANIRKSSKLFVSFKTYKAVTSSTIARWLKLILNLSGIDTSKFKGHSYRSAFSSAAKMVGMSLNDILKTADWSSASTFRKFYYRDIDDNNKSNYINSVFNSTLQLGV